jgi:quercetin dioxygenase-like cupin family protein
MSATMTASVGSGAAMRHAVIALLAGCLATAGVAVAEVPAPVLPAALAWRALPGNPRVEGAWVVGAEQSPGLYALRVRIRHGGAIPPHVHPDTRYSTVLSGTLYVGFGERPDEQAMVAVPAGAAYVAPAGVAHYLSARDGDVEYQEGGFGPTATGPPQAPASAGLALREQVLALSLIHI